MSVADPETLITMPARFAALEAALADPAAAADRDRLKLEIIALFRDADAALGAAAAFKASVKQLAAAWKRLDGGSEVGAAVQTDSTAASAAIPVAAPVPLRVDHLGASTFVEKGWSKLSLGDSAGAEVALRRALELAPGNLEAETLLGWAQMGQAQYESALATFQRVLRQDPEHPLARTNLGYLCLRERQYGEAIDHLSRVIRANHDAKATLYAHLYLGMVYREREMFDDAELFFAKALELGPNLLQAWYECGRSRWAAGRRTEAHAAWRAGAAANMFNPWGKRCAEVLLAVEEGGEPPRLG